MSTAGEASHVWQLKADAAETGLPTSAVKRTCRITDFWLSRGTVRHGMIGQQPLSATTYRKVAYPARRMHRVVAQPLRRRARTKAVPPRTGPGVTPICGLWSAYGQTTCSAR